VTEPEENLQVSSPDAAEPPKPDSRRPLLAERAAWSIVWLTVLSAGISVWGFAYRGPFVVVVAVVMIFGALVGTASCWVARSPRSLLFQGSSMVAALVAMVFPAGIRINVREFYTTDAAAFEQVAGRALQHGADPYVTSMSSAASFFFIPSQFWTYTVNGGHVSHFSYPAGSFLFDTLAMELGFRHMVVDWVDLLAWLVTVVLLFAFLPASLRWLAALMGLAPILLGTFTTGGTDAVFLPFLVLAAWRWDRFGLGIEAGVARWLGPVALGLACAMKQTPWFCVPLLAAGVFLEARRTDRPAGRVLVRYLAIVVVVFVAVNLPFIVWHPSAWLHGTVLPLTGGLVADGQGLVILATQGVAGGVSLTLLSVAAALAMVAVFIAFVVWYGRLKRIALLLVPIPFFFSPRSLSTYLVDVIPVAVVAALSVADAPGPRPSRSENGWRTWPRGLLAVAVAVPSLGVLIAATLAFVGPPLQLSVQGIRTTDGGKKLDAVIISVHNRTAGAVTPHFMINTGGNLTGFWSPSNHRPVVLGAHSSARLTLYPPAQTDNPKKHSRWVMEAYTTNPSWLSTSPLRTSPP
jgi:hypothetical protein